MVVVYKVKAWYANEFILSNATSEISSNRETQC